MEVAILAIVPAGAAVVALTVPARRGEALNQMRYPAAAFGVWVVAYLATRALTESPNAGLVMIVKLVLMLLGGPVSLTALAAVEVDRLRQRYPNDFPFREGPLQRP